MTRGTHKLGGDNDGTSLLRRVESVDRTPSNVVHYVNEAQSWITADDDDGDDTPMSEPSVIPVSPLAGVSANILLVDDNADMREYVGAILRQNALFTVHTVGDGQAALDLVQHSLRSSGMTFQLIISDIMMPVMDGFELVHALKQDPNTARVPVILLSGRAGEEGKVEGLHAGADDYLVKPFSKKELMARVQKHLQLGGIRSQLDQQVALTQEELIKVNMELSESEAKYRVLSTCSPAGIVHTNADGGLIFSNPQFLELIGMSAEDARGGG
eukprot:TRINITY_DN10135_c0_g1_i1.p1 TRINITY_DN10135_c0_g1~~TRINITY_DN10135_c0_g1_i1.p1  ORF type:complete len:310 (+),score=49.00 TRINITY_DN10135_c0_g1_i1:118-930(+)